MVEGAGETVCLNALGCALSYPPSKQVGRKSMPGTVGIQAARQVAFARRFLYFLTGQNGRKILQSNGLFPPPSSHPGP